jgi:hypothetical protein
MAESKTNKNKILLLLIPIAFIVLNLGYLSVIFPLYSGPPGYDQDPAYAYLFNGLLILDGQVPWHVDHPGTPLQFISSAVVLVLNSYSEIFNGVQQRDLIDSVLQNPETYLYGISCALLIMNAGALYYFGYRVLSASKTIWLAIFCQISGVSFAILTPRASYVSPESLLLFATYCLLGLLTPYIFPHSKKPEGAQIVPTPLVGIILGFGLASKVTFIPMLGLIFLVPDFRKRIKILLYAFITFLILITPIYTNFDRMFGWLWSVASHSGIHGSGSQLVMDWSKLLTNIKLVISWYLLLYGVIISLFIFLVATLILRAKKLINNKQESEKYLGEEVISSSTNFMASISIRTPFVFVLVVAAQTMLVLKHPGAHYLIPVLPLAYVGFAWMLYQVNERGETFQKFKSKKFQYVFIIFAAIFAGYGTAPTLKQLVIMKEQRIAQNNALMSIKAEIEKFPNALTICAFRCTTFQYAVSMGLLYAPGLASRPIMQSLLKNFYEYNLLVKEMIAPGIGSFPLAEVPNQINEHGKLFLITPKNYPDLDVFKLQLVVSAGPLTLYEITGLSDELQAKRSHDQTN